MRHNARLMATLRPHHPWSEINNTHFPRALSTSLNNSIRTLITETNFLSASLNNKQLKYAIHPSFAFPRPANFSTMTSVELQDVVVILLVIQGILVQIGCQPLTTNYHHLTLSRSIIEQAKGITDSDFQSDSKLIQVVQKALFTTNYFLPLNSKDLQEEKSLLIFSRNSIDTDQSLVILKKGEDGLPPSESNTFVVLKQIENSEPPEYFPSLVYWR